MITTLRLHNIEQELHVREIVRWELSAVSSYGFTCNSYGEPWDVVDDDVYVYSKL